MKILYRYFLIFIACTSILFGIQIPSFVDQYEKRIDAHFLEVWKNIKGYQEIADRYHAGSLSALIEKHEKSEDRGFREEAGPIKDIYLRYARLKDEKRLLETCLSGKMLFILLDGDREILAETYRNYSFNVPLNRDALLSGAISSALVLVLTELLTSFLSWIFKISRRRRLLVL